MMFAFGCECKMVDQPRLVDTKKFCICLNKNINIIAYISLKVNAFYVGYLLTS